MAVDAALAVQNLVNQIVAADVAVHESAVIVAAAVSVAVQNLAAHLAANAQAAAHVMEITTVLETVAKLSFDA